MFWIKPAKYPTAPQNAQIVLFNWFDYLKPQSGYVGDISLTSEGKIMDNCGWEWGGGNPPVITSQSSVPLDTWTHVAVVWSKVEGYTRIYINNTLDAEIESYCARGSNGYIYPWLAGYGGFVGALDELKIYKVPVAPPFNQFVVAQSQKEELGFEGCWIVSNYQEGGNKTLKYEGDTVTIVKKDDVYYIDGPTWFFAETKFKLDGNMLVGTNIPDIERLKQNWPTAPDSALGSAYGRIVFKGTLTMLKDGRIAGEHDNWKITFFTDTGRLKSVKRYPKYNQFILTRKK